MAGEAVLVLLAVHRPVAGEAGHILAVGKAIAGHVAGAALCPLTHFLLLLLLNRFILNLNWQPEPEVTVIMDTIFQKTFL